MTIRHCKNYTQEELNFIKKNYPVKGAKYCAENLGRTVETIRRQASILRLKRIRDRSGKNNPNWRGGIWTENYCIDCNKKISPYEHKRCRKCMGIWQIGKKRPKLNIKKEKNPNWKGGISERYCMECGKKIHYRANRCVKCANTGSLNPSWVGGLSRFPYPLQFNNELKELIRKRDNYKCQLCGCPQEECVRKLDVHHIDYNKNNLDPKNLITLCKKCHIKTNHNREKWKLQLRQEDL